MRISRSLAIICPVLALLLPLSASAQSQDIHALRIVTQAFEKAKRDNKLKDEFTSKRTHQIDNLNTEGRFESVEKVAIFKIYIKKGKLVQELVDIWPKGSSPARNPVDFDKLLDAFLSRFYFLLSPEREEIDNQSCYKIHFWPKENLPPEREESDYILNRISGVIYITERTYSVKEIDASLSRNVNMANIFYSFYMDRLDLKVTFRDWRRLGLPDKITATTRYSYRKIFSTTRRHQTHSLYYEYGIR